MANLRSVYTRKWLTGDGIDAVFADLSQRQFHGLLVVERTEWDNGPSWILRVPGPITHEGIEYEQDYARRQCWMETRQCFQISHGGSGADFGFWIDVVVANEVALRYGGTVVDEGDGKRCQPEHGLFPTYESYCLATTSRVGNDRPPADASVLRRYVLQDRLEFCPPAFRFSTGKRVVASGGIMAGTFTLSEED